MLLEQIRKHSLQINTMNDLDTLVNAVGDADIVLLGEASHGTSEFYTYRAELTQRLIEQKQFNFIAVEGDGPSCYRINQFIKQAEGANEAMEDALRDFIDGRLGCGLTKKLLI